MITPQVKHERTQRCIECIRKVTPTAENYGIQLNLEVLNRFENYIINTVEEGLSFIGQVESDHCGLVLDIFHMNMEEDDLPGRNHRRKGPYRAVPRNGAEP